MSTMTTTSKLCLRNATPFAEEYFGDPACLAASKFEDICIQNICARGRHPMHIAWTNLLRGLIENVALERTERLPHAPILPIGVHPVF